MRVIELKAENFKRIKAITIRPGDNPVVEISGKNSQGKSSTIDAIWTALQGAAVLKSTPKPVRKGAQKAEIVLNLGEYIVTRRMTADGGASLTVTTPDGAKQKSPQALLDGLLGSLTFDPLAWIRMSDKDQAAALLSMLKIDLTRIDIDRQTAYDNRTVVNRDVTRIKAEIASIPAPTEKLPAAPIDTAAEMNRQRQMQTEARRLDQLSERIEVIQEKVTANQHTILQLQAENERFEADLKVMQVERDNAKYPDLDEVNATIANAGRINTAIAARDRSAKLKAELAAAETKSAALTTKIDGAAEAKRAALGAVKMPVPGMSVNEDTGLLMLNGIPLKQTSRSEQLRTAVAMAMAEHPELRVMRIEDASVLDADSMAMIRELAAENDYQLWMEVVDESGAVGVYIEDGEIAINNMTKELDCE
jgi:hypothetical protein